MVRIVVVAALVCMLSASVCISAEKDSNEELIPVRPSYQEAAYTPGADAEYTGPKPKDQMYVFWLLGRIISYPVDQAESYVRGLISGPTVKPAAAPRPPDPFADVDKREIPPAPPVKSASK